MELEYINHVNMERNYIIQLLRTNGKDEDVFYRLLMHYAAHFKAYRPIEIGQFVIFSQNDPRSCMQAVHEIISEVFPNTDEKLSFLKKFKDYFPEGHKDDGTNTRVCALLIAYYLFKNKQYEACLKHVREALSIYTGCMISSYLYGEIKRLQNDEAEINLKNKFCVDPFENFRISNGGSVHLCCPSNMPIVVGNVFQQELDEIWNSMAAQEVRKSILDGSFKYCNRFTCGKLYNLPDKKNINKYKEIIASKKTALDLGLIDLASIGHDWRCNLRCPSCRTENYRPSSDEIKLYDVAHEKVIIPLTHYAKRFHVTGGDPFASKHTIDLLRKLNGNDFPQIDSLGIHTNGVLLTEKQWESIVGIETIKHVGVSVSIDAATEETYKKVRVGGDWNQLNLNLKFLSSLRKRNKISSFIISLVVQDHNFKEMPEFVLQGVELNCDQIHFIQIYNTGTFTNSEFKKRLVSVPSHQNYKEFLMILHDPILIKYRHMISFVPDNLKSLAAVAYSS